MQQKSIQTLAGSMLKRAQLKGFGTAWVTPEGIAWSSYQGLHSNAGTASGDIMLNSPATQACEAMGGRLPTIEDYRALMKHFRKPNGGNDLDSFKVFSNDMIQVYWTATAHTSFFARIVKGMDDFGDLAPTTSRLHAVRCVGLAKLTK